MAIQGIKAQYEQRGPVPQDVIHAVAFEPAAPAAGRCWWPCWPRPSIRRTC